MLEARWRTSRNSRAGALLAALRIAYQGTSTAHHDIPLLDEMSRKRRAPGHDQVVGEMQAPAQHRSRYRPVLPRLGEAPGARLAHKSDATAARRARDAGEKRAQEALAAAAKQINSLSSPTARKPDDSSTSADPSGLGFYIEGLATAAGLRPRCGDSAPQQEATPRGSPPRSRRHIADSSRAAASTRNGKSSPRMRTAGGVKKNLAALRRIRLVATRTGNPRPRLSSSRQVEPPCRLRPPQESRRELLHRGALARLRKPPSSSTRAPRPSTPSSSASTWRNPTSSGDDSRADRQRSRAARQQEAMVTIRRGFTR